MMRFSTDLLSFALLPHPIKSIEFEDSAALSMRRGVGVEILFHAKAQRRQRDGS
jgi:hypothetical protein